MTIYNCNNCLRQFKQKCHLDNHLYKKLKPCISNNIIQSQQLLKAPPNPAKAPPKTAKLAENSTEIPPNSTNSVENLTIFTENTNKLIELMFKEPLDDLNDKNDIICIYCEKNFTRTDSLKKHHNGRCKSKINHDDLRELKEDMKNIITNLKNLENENANLKNNYQQLENDYNKILNDETHVANNKNITKKTINNTNNSTNIHNNNNNNNINNGIVNNINIVQFGEEDIDKLNLPEAVKQYLISTGGNIASNMLKYINLNEKYPENHNICITDMSRELVKIHNGKKFITKKFKNVKNDIMKNVVKNTRRIMDNYENNTNFKKSSDTKTKLKINEVSLKLIDGVSGEEIVRDEIKEKDKLLNLKKKSTKDINNTKVDNSESDEERDFTFEERLRIEHLDKKRDGLQIKTFDNLKDELYNARELLADIN